MPGGRPSDYDEGYCEMLIEHMAQGLSFEAFGGVVRASKKTLYAWTQAHEEFLNAKSIGETASLYYWEKVGRDGLYNETIKDGDGMTITKSINSSVWIFNMKNRHLWRDKQKDEDAPPPQVAQPVQLTQAQLLELVKQAKGEKT